MVENGIVFFENNEDCSEKEWIFKRKLYLLYFKKYYTTCVCVYHSLNVSIRFLCTTCACVYIYIFAISSFYRLNNLGSTYVWQHNAHIIQIKRASAGARICELSVIVKVDDALQRSRGFHLITADFIKINILARALLSERSQTESRPQPPRAQNRVRYNRQFITLIHLNRQLNSKHFIYCAPERLGVQ